MRFISSQSANEIVSMDYRTALVFRKYGIEFCCGGKWALSQVCEVQQLDINEVVAELDLKTRTISMPIWIDFNHWDANFLIDYITCVHHKELQRVLPVLEKELNEFASDHIKKFPNMGVAVQLFKEIRELIIRQCEFEDTILFPRIKQLLAAVEHETATSSNVPMLENTFQGAPAFEMQEIKSLMERLKELCNDFMPPANACNKHQVCFGLLKEFDQDMQQHLYLETEVLLPKLNSADKNAYPGVLV